MDPTYGGHIFYLRVEVEDKDNNELIRLFEGYGNEKESLVLVF